MMILLLAILSIAIYAVLGYPFARQLFGIDDKDKEINSFAVFFSAPIIGYLGFSFLVYVVSTTIGIGIGKFSVPLLFALILLVLYTHSQGHLSLFKQSINFIRGKYFLICAFGLAWVIASFHIWSPLVLNNWEMAYSVGNDSTRYVAMIEYLQKSYWIYGGALVEPLNYPFGNRPLMHYQQALPNALYSVSIFSSYSISSIINTCLTFNAIVLLGVVAYDKFSYFGMYVVALAVGLAGGLGNVYYSGFVAQYFSVLAIFFGLSSLYWVSSFKIRFVATLLALAVVAASYSVGFAILVAVMLLVGRISQVLLSNVSIRRFTKESLALLFVTLVVVYIFNYELKIAAEFFKPSRNLSFAFELDKAALYYSGIISKWHDIVSIPSYLLWLYLIVAIALPSATVAYAWQNRARSATWFYMCMVFLLFVAGLYLTGDFYLFNKHSVIFLPIILVVVFAILTDHLWMKGAGRLMVAFLILVISYAGYDTLSTFHVELAKDRKTYIDQTVISSKQTLLNYLVPGETIYSADTGIERNLLMRVVYSQYQWLPVVDSQNMAEYGITREQQAKRMSIEHPSVVFAAKDYSEPQWAGYADRQGDIFDGGWFGLYKNAGIIELEGDWQPAGRLLVDDDPKKRRNSKRAPKKGGVSIFNISCAEIILETQPNKNISDMHFYGTNGGKVMPRIESSPSKTKLIFNCESLKSTNLNYLLGINTDSNNLVVSSIYVH